MQSLSWFNNHSGPFPPRYERNTQWPREQLQRHHQQFSKYDQTQPQHRFTENYWCETCDRGFATQDLLDKHKQQHQKCNIDGCQFVAHPKVITKHIQMQHSTGLFKKIANLNNPEEIKKWITERKKRYPTKINVEKKTAERREKIERGEKIGLQHSPDNNFRHGTYRKRKLFDGGKRYKKNNRIQDFDQTIKNIKSKNVKEHASRKDPKLIFHETEDSENRKLKHFSGIRNLILDVECEEKPEQGPHLSDDEEELQEIAGVEPKFCDALSSLISSYQDSSDEVDSTKELNATTVKECEKSETQNRSLCKKSNKSSENIEDSSGCSDNDSGPEEVKKIKSVIETIIPVQQNSSKQEKIKGSKKISNGRNHSKRNISKQKFKPKLPSTLLQKLLHREIQQERNIVLQCVNYIVKHNFFDKPE